MEDLKDLIIQTLDSQGTLETIRAQLRLLVFKSIDNEGKTIPMDKTQVMKLMDTEQGALCVEILKDFLESFKLNLSLNVLIPEARMHQEIPKDKLQRLLGFAPVQGVPLIFQIIDKVNEKPPQTSPARVVEQSAKKEEEPAKQPQHQYIASKQDSISTSQSITASMSTQAASAQLPELAKVPKMKLAPLKEPVGGIRDQPKKQLVGESEEDTNAREKQHLMDFDKKMEEMKQADKRGRMVNINKDLDELELDPSDQEVQEEIDDEEVSIEFQTGNRERGVIEMSGGTSSGVDPSIDSAMIDRLYDYSEEVEVGRRR